MSRLKPELRTKPIGAAHEVKGMEFSLQAALAMSRLKPELQTKPIGAAHDLTGMEFSLQAALCRNPIGEVGRSALRLHGVSAG